MRYFLTKKIDKNFITHEDSLNSVFKGYLGNVWSVDPKQADISKWIEKNNAIEKTKEEAQLIIDNEIQKAQDYWDSLTEDEKQYNINILSRTRFANIVIE